MDKKALSRFLSPVIVGALIWFSPIPNGVSPDAWHVLAMMTAIIVGFIAVPVNIGCVAFIGLMAVMLTGTLSPGAALKGFSNTLLWLIVTAFLFSRAFVKTGLGERISLWILSKIGDSSLKVAYGLTISGSLLAAGIPSGTARAGGVIYPILRSICSALGSEPDKNPDKIGRFLIQSYFHSEAFISYLFLTAMAGNVLVMQFAQDLANVSITWGGWAVGAFLPAIVSIILVPYCTYLLVPPQLKKSPGSESRRTTYVCCSRPGKNPRKTSLRDFLFLHHHVDARRLHGNRLHSRRTHRCVCHAFNGHSDLGGCSRRIRGMEHFDVDGGIGLSGQCTHGKGLHGLAWNLHGGNVYRHELDARDFPHLPFL